MARLVAVVACRDRGVRVSTLQGCCFVAGGGRCHLSDFDRLQLSWFVPSRQHCRTASSSLAQAGDEQRTKLEKLLSDVICEGRDGHSGTQGTGNAQKYFGTLRSAVEMCRSRCVENS